MNYYHFSFRDNLRINFQKLFLLIWQLQTQNHYPYQSRIFSRCRMKLSYVSILFIVAFATSGIKSQSVTDNLIDGKLSVKMKLTSEPIMHVTIKGVISWINVIDHHLVNSSKRRFKHSLYTINMYDTIIILSQ